MRKKRRRENRALLRIVQSNRGSSEARKATVSKNRENIQNDNIEKYLKGSCKDISLHLHRAEKSKNSLLKLMAHTCC